MALVSRHISPEQAYEVSVAFDVLRGRSDRQREVYLLRHYFGLEIQDIAHVLDRQPSTVWVQLSRVQKRIIRRLGHLDESAKHTGGTDPGVEDR